METAHVRIVLDDCSAVIVYSILLSFCDSSILIFIISAVSFPVPVPVSVYSAVVYSFVYCIPSWQYL